MKRILGLLISVLLACSLLVACSSSSADQDASQEPSASEDSAGPDNEPSQEPSASEQASSSGGTTSASWPVTVTDLQGTEVTVGGADRIVSLTPSATEILIAEGAEGRIVGIDASSPEVEGAEICGDYNGPDVEKVASLEPDLVISGNSIQEDQIQQMRNLGLTVVSAEATTWEQIPESYTLIGTCVGEPDAAQALVTSLNETVGQAEAERPASSPSVYYVLSFGDAGNWTSGPGSFINSMIQIAGGTCVTEDGASAWLEYPIEDLVAANPDVIIFSSGAGSYEDLVKAQGYSELDAVKNGRVFEIDADTASRPGPDIGDALLSISSILQTATAEDATQAEASAEASGAEAASQAA